jgi:glycine dehydrogenase subunit 2
VVEVPSDASGRVDLAALASLITHETAAMMVTNPNTLGIFESDIHKISDMLHEVGAFLYMDGANLNALVGKARPGDMGVDVMHINLHKTFSTPHGGGGPGSGPVCSVEELAPFLPGPHLGRNDQGLLQWQEAPSAFGRVHSFFGHPGVAIRALSWILTLGPEGLRQHTEHAVLNNNYLRSKLKTLLHLPFEAPTLHETVFSDKDLHDCGVTTMDLAKALLDRGFHPPTVYFPLVVPGALMVEPTETESRGELDRFVAAIESIVRQAEVDPESVKAAPERTPFGRMDETRAARQPVLKWQPNS